MHSRLDLVIENFREFLKSIKYDRNGDQLDIEYTPMSYDYIDDDLDFDEEYYTGLCNSFQKWMETVAVDMVRFREAGSVKVTRNRMLFRDKDVHVETVVIKMDDSEQYIRLNREIRLNIDL